MQIRAFFYCLQMRVYSYPFSKSYLADHTNSIAILLSFIHLLIFSPYTNSPSILISFDLSMTTWSLIPSVSIILLGAFHLKSVTLLWSSLLSFFVHSLRFLHQQLLLFKILQVQYLFLHHLQTKILNHLLISLFHLHLLGLANW